MAKAKLAITDKLYLLTMLVIKSLTPLPLLPWLCQKKSSESVNFLSISNEKLAMILPDSSTCFNAFKSNTHTHTRLGWHRKYKFYEPQLFENNFHDHDPLCLQQLLPASGCPFNNNRFAWRRKILQKHYGPSITPVFKGQLGHGSRSSGVTMVCITWYGRPASSPMMELLP